MQFLLTLPTLPAEPISLWGGSAASFQAAVSLFEFFKILNELLLKMMVLYFLVLKKNQYVNYLLMHVLITSLLLL